MTKQKWIKTDGTRYDGRSIVVGDRRIFNPTDAQLTAAGYVIQDAQPYVPTLNEVKARKIAEIDAYDTSEAVNSFSLDGSIVWLDKATRVGLMNSLGCEKAAGREQTTLWLGTTPIQLNIDRAISLLSAVELYALECYNVTAAHKAAIEVADSIEAIQSYDHTTGYPERLDISTT